MERTLHPAPRMRDVVLEQIRIVGVSLRREALAGAVVIGLVTIAIFADMFKGTAATWFDSDDEWFGVTVISFLFAFAVWWRDRPFGNAFLWTLPVDRRRLALAKVFAGWFWLMTALLTFALWEVVLAFVAGVLSSRTIPLLAFPGTTAMYLLSSALLLGLRHPLRWLFGGASLLFLLRVVDEMLRFEPLIRPAGFPHHSQWPLLTFIWIAAGAIALWAAVSRHRENR